MSIGMGLSQEGLRNTPCLLQDAEGAPQHPSPAALCWEGLPLTARRRPPRLHCYLSTSQPELDTESHTRPLRPQLGSACKGVSPAPCSFPGLGGSRSCSRTFFPTCPDRGEECMTQAAGAGNNPRIAQFESPFPTRVPVSYEGSPFPMRGPLSHETLFLMRPPFP